MKRILFIFAILGLTTMVAFGQNRTNIPVSAFTGINATGLFEITVQRGNTESLVIENSAGQVHSEVRDGVLHLNPAGGQVTIVMRNLEYVRLSGSGSLVANDLFTPNSFRFNGSGASSITINLNTNQLDIEMGGASRVELNANVSGYTRFNVTGTGNISGNLVTERAVFDYRGAGVTTLTGSAAHAIINASGTANLNLVGFPIRAAIVNAPGASNITVNATNSLEINASGVSTVRHTGTTNVQKSNSGMSTINRL